MVMQMVRLFAFAAVAFGLGNLALAQEAQPPRSPAKKEETKKQDAKPAESIKIGKLKQLSEEYEVWIDEENKQVVVGGEITLTKGMLEMFACLKGTKEHESIVAVNSAAYVVHAALLSLGTKQGTPVRFEPEYRPASGAKVAVYVEWEDKAGKKQIVRAQEWVRKVKTMDILEYDWVFAGSGFWRDEDTGKMHYMAEGGDLICVSNFPSAMLDLPIKSSMDNEGLLFEAFTERIPERGTKVRLILKPELEPKAPAGDAKSKKAPPVR